MHCVTRSAITPLKACSGTPGSAFEWISGRQLWWLRGTGTAAAVELIAVGLDLGCVDLFGVRVRHPVREHMPVSGIAGAVDLPCRPQRRSRSGVCRTVQGRRFPSPGDAQRENRRLAAHRQWHESARSHSCRARRTASRPAVASHRQPPCRIGSRRDLHERLDQAGKGGVVHAAPGR